jgi:hypothetical protein
LKFSLSGKFVTAIGADLFAVPHGLYVDRNGNVWAGDQLARNGKGADLIEFSPNGKVLLTIGKPGMPGNEPGWLSSASSVVVAPNGGIYVGDGHGIGTNDRIVKFSKDGKFIMAWGKHGTAAGRSRQQPHPDFLAGWAIHRRMEAVRPAQRRRHRQQRHDLRR